MSLRLLVVILELRKGLVDFSVTIEKDMERINYLRKRRKLSDQCLSMEKIGSCYLVLGKPVMGKHWRTSGQS